ncbi:MAG: alpha/beta fold hydrolase [Deferrisomatales bacterium]
MRGTARRRVSFPNGRGQLLAGRLDLPEEGAPWAHAVLAHCFTCTKDLKALYHLGGALAGAGVGALRVDFAGLGESEGDFAETGLAANAEDVVSAGRYLEDEGRAPSLLVGHSLGGAAALLAARRLPSVRAVAVIATSADAGRLRESIIDPRASAGRGNRIPVKVGPRHFELDPAFFEEMERTDVAGAARDLGLPLLVIHSADDRLVPVADGEALFQNAGHPKGFVSLTGVDHLLSEAADATRVGGLIAAWARLHVPD